MPTEDSPTILNTVHQTTDGYYLPDFNSPQAFLAMLLSIELLVGALSLMKFPLGSIEFFGFFTALSLLMIWVAMVFALVMHFSKKWLMKQKLIISTFIQLTVFVFITASVTFIAKIIVASYFKQTSFANSISENTQLFFVNNLFICLIFGGLFFRYFYIAHQNQERTKAVGLAKIQALQARIRPHFLFNSLNSIASLIRIDPQLAEQSVEDLSDLFRASLADESKRVSLKDELEIARLYQRIEQIRLGDRLKIEWNIGDLPLIQKVPVLIIQPLLENAVYHGIEPLTAGGKITINAYTETNAEDEYIIISVQNPIAQIDDKKQFAAGRKNGNQIAMQNIQQRLRLRYGEKASVVINSTANDYQVSLKFPCEESF